MYGKIFDSIYDGTLRANWQALITFQQLIILADKDGVVDMTPHAIHGRTGIPLDIIEAGLDHLSKPDPYSRSNTEEGRRIVLLDEHRPWGWRLVNHAYYRNIISREEKREKDRKRISEKRKESTMSHDVAESRSESRRVVNVAHTDTDTDTDTDTELPVVTSIKTETVVALKRDSAEQREKNKTLREDAKQALQFLNTKTGKAFREVDANLKPIESLLKSGVTLQDVKTVTMRKVRDWQADPKMSQYLRPSTLYRRSNFEQYLGQTIVPEVAHG